jgi:hypothetical protein
MQHIADYLNACGEPEMADEVLNAHNRLEAFSEGLDRDSHLAILRAVEYLMAQRDELATSLRIVLLALQYRTTGDRYLGIDESAAVAACQKFLDEVKGQP